MTTTFSNSTDFRKSLEARLHNFASKNNQDLQRIRRKVAFERLLARIFHSDNDDFILKGGYAMELRFTSARATKDIDLTCLLRPESPNSAFEQIISQELQELAAIDLNDFFTFEIGQARMDLDNAPYGGARYSVASFVDKRLFVRFQLDVGGDALLDEIEYLEGSKWLEHYGIDTPKIKMISVEQQLAEKFHAYSLPRDQRGNTRVKDLIDMLLLTRLRQIDTSILKLILQKVFQMRGTHLVPENFELPPPEWEPVYDILAAECGIKENISQAYNELRNFFNFLSLMNV